MSKIFFTSDTHFGHANIIKYCGRPFLSDLDKRELERIGAWHDGHWKGENASNWRMTPEAVQMMDDALIEGINSTVGEDDELRHLGDFSMAGKGNNYERCRRYRDRIKCRNVHIVWGNHDDRRIHSLFSSAQDLTEIEVQGQKIVLCHYAMAIFNKSHRGAMHLYGHSHSGAEPWMDKTMPGRRSMDVGVDNAYKLLGSFRPFSFDEIMAIMKNRSGFSMDHHVQRGGRR